MIPHLRIRARLWRWLTKDQPVIATGLITLVRAGRVVASLDGDGLKLYDELERPRVFLRTGSAEAPAQITLTDAAGTIRAAVAVPADPPSYPIVRLYDAEGRVTWDAGLAGSGPLPGAN